MRTINGVHAAGGVPEAAKAAPRPAAVTGWLTFWQTAVLGVLMLALAYVTWAMVPELRREISELRQERRLDADRRKDELDRARAIELIQKRQTVTEALLLAEQEKNLKLARELGEALRKAK